MDNRIDDNKASQFEAGFKEAIMGCIKDYESIKEEE